MSGGSDDPQTTQSTQTNKPWSAQQPYLQAVMAEAANLYAGGQGGAYYPGSTYVSPTSYETDAFQRITGLAERGNPLLGGALGQAGDMLRSGGLTDEQKNAGRMIGQVADGTDQITTGGSYGQLFGALGGPSYGEQYGNNIASGGMSLETGDEYRNALHSNSDPSVSRNQLLATARGENIGVNNEALMGVLDRSAQRAGQSVNSLMGGAGRYGGASHQGVLARETGDLYQRGLSEQMNQDLNRQMAAAGQIDSADASQMQQRMGLLSGLTGVQQQNIGNRLGAASQMDQSRLGYNSARQSALAGQTGVQGANIANRVGASQNLNEIYSQGNQLAMQYAQMMPQLNQARYADANTLLQAGGAQRGELQTELQENVNRFNSEQNRGWEQLARLAQFSSGIIPSGYGTSTSSVPKGSAFSGILGGAAAGGSMGSAFGPWGTLAGLIGGGTAGAFM